MAHGLKKKIYRSIKHYIPMERKKALKRINMGSMPNKYKKPSCKAELAFSKLIKGNSSEALKIFIEVITNSGYKNKDKIIECFKNLTLMRSGLSNTNNNIIANDSMIPDKILFVEGMSSSGSSATFDYLSTFSQVSVTKAFKPTTPAYRSIKIARANYGINHLILNNNSIEEFTKKIIIFFDKHILGLTDPISKSDRKVIRDSRDRMQSNSQDDILDCFLLFTNDLIKNNKNMNIDVFLSQNIDIFIKRFLTAICSDPRSSNIMVRNMFKLTKDSYDTIKYLSNYWYIPTFRDPRSQYADKKIKGSKIKLSNFISFYKHTRERFERNLKKGILDINKTMIVQYEDLVLSESYRTKLASILGINVLEKNRPKNFDPEESLKNVYIYENFEDKKSIKRIESELSKYLYC